MKVLERFLNYIQINTKSNEDCDEKPSTKEQFRLARLLVHELQSLGIEAWVDEKCYVYGMIPATEGFENAPSLGFISHMDTVSDFAEHDVKPMIHEKYSGEDLFLGEGRRLTKKMFPHLASLAGRTLITSDGSTILGADDKAGIAEIMTMGERLLDEKIPHGKICLGFTPDEEIGRGADDFDLKAFGANFAYTLDGDEEGEISFENFNAAGVTLKISGVNVHPGSAKDVMVNAIAVGCEFQSMLPEAESPGNTEGYEGFYHLISAEGNVEKAVFSYIVREHDGLKFLQKKDYIESLVEQLNRKYGCGTISMDWKEQYRNMEEIIREEYHLVETAAKAAKVVGLKPRIRPIRGGTDGAKLSFAGLPCPNLGTGGYAYHGPYEHITLEGMEKTVELLIEIVKRYSKKNDGKDPRGFTNDLTNKESECKI